MPLFVFPSKGCVLISIYLREISEFDHLKTPFEQQIKKLKTSEGNTEKEFVMSSSHFDVQGEPKWSFVNIQFAD